MTVSRNIAATVVLLVMVGQAGAQQQMRAENFDLADYRGKIVYIDFWASWCTPCRASFPFMAELADTHADNLAIVAINVDENQADAEAFLKDYETPFDIVFDQSGKLAEAFNVPGMPTSFLHDREGELIGQHVGFRKKDMDAIRQWIKDSVDN